MKRRNAECGKIRRPVKRTKITEGFYRSTFLYVKFLVVWAVVLLADFILEFRFEYLWPFWLLLRSVYDSFKYQGLAFSVFFVFIAFTSDMICFLFIPVHWLFFAASTYVWVQYVWHTERGVCLPTISLWLLFVYIEASVRLKELKNLPFHLDLCRPFAAHCIGYPVVTLGFGFKSYVGYRMRLRKQKEVAKENEFFNNLLQQALPAEAPSISNAVCTQDKEKPKTPEEPISNGHCITANNNNNNSQNTANRKNIINNNNSTPPSQQQQNGSALMLPAECVKSYPDTDCAKKHSDYQFIESSEFVEESDESVERLTMKINGVAGGKGKWAKDNLGKRRSNSTKEVTSSVVLQKDDHTFRLEADLKRLKADLQGSRQNEQDLKTQIHSISAGERSVKNDLMQLQQENDTLQHKMQSLTLNRHQDKQLISSLEKRLQEERKSRTTLETQLSTERKAKKADDAAAAKALALANTRTPECTESCKTRRREMETELKQLRRDLKLRDDKIQQFERQAQCMSSYQESIGSTQALVSALNAMEEKSSRLEKSLSAETRLKLDLFSALGECKRQLEIAQTMLAQRDKEIDELKVKITEVMAVMPVSSSPNCYSPNPPPISLAVSSLLYSPKYNMCDDSRSKYSMCNDDPMPKYSMCPPSADDSMSKYSMCSDDSMSKYSICSDDSMSKYSMCDDGAMPKYSMRPPSTDDSMSKYSMCSDDAMSKYNMCDDGAMQKYGMCSDDAMSKYSMCEDGLPKVSTLDPNASVYTPKVSRLDSDM